MPDTVDDGEKIWRELAERDNGGQPEGAAADQLEGNQGEKSSDDSGQSGDAPPSPAAEAPPAGSEKADDPWANAPPELKSLFEAERKERERAENAARSNGARASQAHRELAELRRSQAAPPAPAAEQQGGAAPGGAADADDPLARVVEEYPDVAGPLVQTIKDLHAKVETLSADRSKQVEAEAARDELAAAQEEAKQEQFLAQQHPDWFEVATSEGWRDWVKTQPRYVQEAVARNGNGIVDGTEAADILGRYKATLSTAQDPLAERRRHQLDGSRSVDTRARTAPALDGGDNASPEAIWAELARDEARKAARQRR